MQPEGVREQLLNSIRAREFDLYLIGVRLLKKNNKKLLRQLVQNKWLQIQQKTKLVRNKYFPKKKEITELCFPFLEEIDN